jgi:membrane-bound metal-dependent hydrolase YbcI (DUF457 family)
VPDSRAILVAAAILFFAFVGLTFPDIDQPLPLDHRSALTHSVIPAALALWRRWARPVAAGLALGIGLHLAADVFPNAMVGYATVKMPFAGGIGSDASYIWLAANSLGCTALGVWLTRTGVGDLLVRRILFGAVILLGAAYLLVTDGGWPALAIYAGAGWLTLRFLRRPGSYGLR